MTLTKVNYTLCIIIISLLFTGISVAQVSGTKTLQGSILTHTNIYRFEESDSLTIIVGADTVYSKKTKETKWLGWLQWFESYKGIDPGFYQGAPPPTQCYYDDVQIGMRGDGVLVWRRTKK